MNETKMTSRKFLVWIVATIYFIGTLIYAFITKDAGPAQDFTPWWGTLSVVYIGGNVAQKFAPAMPEQTATGAEDEA